MLLKGSSATNVFAEGLKQSGILCEQEIVYKVLPFIPSSELKNRALRLLKDNDVSLSVCATSSFALRSFVDQFEVEPFEITQLPVCVIGPKTAQTAKILGFSKYFQAKKANVESLAKLFDELL